MSQPLDRSKPLWEIWVVEGLEDGHWAVMSKTHHAMVDGVSGTDLLALIMDLSPEPIDPEPTTWTPEPAPSGLLLAVQASVDLLAQPVRAGSGPPRRGRRTPAGPGPGA